MSDVGGGFSLPSGSGLADVAALADAQEGWQAAIGSIQGAGAPDVSAAGAPSSAPAPAGSPSPSPGVPAAASSAGLAPADAGAPASLAPPGAGQAAAASAVALPPGALPPVVRIAGAATPNVAAPPGRADIAGQPVTVALDTGQATAIAAAAPLPPPTPVSAAPLASAAPQASLASGAPQLSLAGGAPPAMAPTVASLPQSLQTLLAAAGYAKPANAPQAAATQASATVSANAPPTAGASVTTGASAPPAVVAGTPSPAAQTARSPLVTLPANAPRSSAIQASAPVAAGASTPPAAAPAAIASTPVSAAQTARPLPGAQLASTARPPDVALPVPKPAAAAAAHAASDHAQAGQTGQQSAQPQPAQQPAQQQPAQTAPTDAQPATPAATTVAIQAPHIHGVFSPQSLLGAPALAMMLENLPPMRRGRPDRERVLRRDQPRPQPELWLSSILASLPEEEYVTYTDHRPLPLDLYPFRPDLACWRLDDTETLVRAVDHPVAARRAASLHASLMAGAPALASLHPGEGFATWQGSPLWLRLAGVAKPAELGVLLAESRPARVDVTRQGAANWHVVHHRAGLPAQQALRLTGRADDPALVDAVLYGLWRQKPAPGSDQAAGHDPIAIARAQLARAASIAAPQGWRQQEAWCAVLRCLRDTLPGDGAGEAALAIAGAAATGHASRPAGDVAHGADDSFGPAGNTLRVTGMTRAAAPEHGMPADRRAGQGMAVSSAAVLDSLRHDHPDAFAARLHALSQLVLARVTAGDVEQLDRIEGLSLAAAIGRLTPSQVLIGASR